jgi:CBS domain-containing protein
MTIANFIDDSRGEVIKASPTDSVAAAIDLLAKRRIGCIPVVDGETVAGIFSERDVIYGLAEHGARFLDMAVGDVMTKPAVTVGKHMPILTALSLMTRRRIRHLPIVEQGRMVGFISIGDLVKSRIDRIESEAAAMREYIQSA